MRYPKLRELREAIKALIKGPYTSKFPFEPHVPFVGFRGRPKFYQDDCVGCTACAQVCPARAISFEDVKGIRRLTIRWDLCVFCGQCQANCLTEKGIMLSEEFDLAITGNREKELNQTIEKELVFCECCGEAIIPKDQILWVAKRLGPLAFSNATVMLVYLNNLKLSLQEKISAKKGQEFLRSDRISILCPRCRRQVVIKS